MRVVLSLFVVMAFCLGASSVAPRAAQQGCLNDSETTPEQKARRSVLIGLARDINNQQRQSMQTSGSYQPFGGLKMTRPVPDGIEIKLAAEGKTYAFSIVDKTDACRAGVFSNDAGLIYTGQALQ